ALIIRAFEVERDAHAISRGGAVIIVEDRLAHAAVLARTHEWRHNLGRNTDRAVRGLVDDCPPAHRPDVRLSLRADELHVAVVLGSLRLLAGPGSRGDPVALESGTQIVDLVPHHDPEVRVLVVGIGDAAPMCDGDLLHPLHPY